MNKIYLPESVGSRPELLGPRPKDSSENYSVVIATERVFGTVRLEQPVPPEVVENDIFGFPIVDERILLFADTNAYGIDERKWVLDASQTPETLVPSNLRLWSTIGNPYFTDTTATYKGLDTKAEYGKTSIDLSVPLSPVQLNRFVLCSTKQSFDCPGASNLFVSFGIQCDIESNSTKRAGMYSESTGWYLEILGNGVGDNFRVVQRYRGLDGQIINKPYPRSSAVFKDRLDGNGASGLNVDFTLVAMYAIELGSYDGTAVRLYIYARDNAQGGAHRWIMFASIPTSDVASYVERNPVALPVTFELNSNGEKLAFLNKYGTSVTKCGSEDAPLRIFSVPGVQKELVAEKEVFSMGLLTKELFNLQANTTQQFPKYLSVNSNVPVEVVVRRVLIDQSNIRAFPFLPPIDEKFDREESLFLVVNGAILLCSLENQSVYQKLTIDGGYELIAYDSHPDRNYIYATQRDNANIIILDASSGNIINRIPGANRGIPSDLRVVGNNLFVIHPADGNLTVWDLTTISQPNRTPVETIIVGTNPQRMVDGDGKIFVTNRGSNSISVIDVSTTNFTVTTINNDGLNQPLAIVFSRGLVYVANQGEPSEGKKSVFVYDTVQNQRLGEREFNVVSSSEPPVLIEVIEAIKSVYTSDINGVVTVVDYTFFPEESITPELLINYQRKIVSLVSSPSLELLIFDGSSLLNFSTNEVLIDLQSPINILIDQLSFSGVSPLLIQKLSVTGEKIFSFISSGPKQFNLVKIFQEYREFFASSFDNFRRNETVSQDMILFFVKNVGELLSQESNQIDWVLGSSSESPFGFGQAPLTFTKSSDVQTYPPFVSNPGFASLSLISSQY